MASLPFDNINKYLTDNVEKLAIQRKNSNNTWN